MHNKGFTLVEIMIVMAIITLLAAIAIPQLLRAKITANESTAQATLRAMSCAFEKYAVANKRNYPTRIDQLISATSSYLDEDYVATSPRQEYIFTIVAYGANYCIQAAPEPGSQGRTYNIKTGGILSEGGC